MGPANYAVAGCYNSIKILDGQNQISKFMEPVMWKQKGTLFKFPSVLRNSRKQEEWIRQFKHENRDISLENHMWHGVNISLMVNQLHAKLSKEATRGVL